MTLIIIIIIVIVIVITVPVTVTVIVTIGIVVVVAVIDIFIKTVNVICKLFSFQILVSIKCFVHNKAFQNL